MGIPKIFNTKTQKIVLNLSLVAIIGLIEYGGIYLIIKLAPEQFYVIKNGEETINPNFFIFISVSLIIGWLGILLGYYAWAIYFYNINLGFTNEDWAKMKKRKAEEEALKKLGKENAAEGFDMPSENPYKDETFGLPGGTVRGTIALSLLVGGFSLLILSQNPSIYEQAEVVEKYLEYFKTAFLMMIAFYFGSQSLKFLKTPTSVPSEPTPSKPSPGPRTTASKSSESLPNVYEEEAPKTEELPLPPNFNSLTASKPREEINKIEVPKIVEKTVTQNENNKKITEQDIIQSAEELDIEPALIAAVLKAESSGSGFLSDGRPKILFEGHIFWKLLKKAGKNPEEFSSEHPDIVYPTWTKKYYSTILSDEYKRLDKAILIDRDAAYQSVSWGLCQIMGMNYKKAGFDSVNDFVNAQKENEKQQLTSFINYLKSENLIDLLKNHDWRGFALRYNGPGYEANDYHTKIEKAYADYIHRHTPVINVTITRTISNEKETLGKLSVYNADREIFTCKTLELPWKENKNNISCIPIGKYKVEKRYSKEHNSHFHILDVKDRAWILIHSGNYYTETRGCILVGNDFVDINKDGFNDVANSRVTLQKLFTILPQKFDMEILNKTT